MHENSRGTLHERLNDEPGDPFVVLDDRAFQFVETVREVRFGLEKIGRASGRERV